MSKVSVIVPMYNVEKYIGRAIESLIGQTFKDIEIILVDDGSNDNTLKQAKSYKDERIKILTKNNAGAASARNLGILNASSEYLMFLDADDYYEPDCIEKAYYAITDSNSDICIFGSHFIDENRTFVKDVSYERKGAISIKENKEILLKIENCPWDKIYRTSVIKKNHIIFPEGLYYEDFAFTFNLLAHVEKISFIDDVLINYIVGRDGNQTNELTDRVYDIFKIIDIIIDEYQRSNIYDEFYEEIKAIGIINIVDRLKLVVKNSNKSMRDHFINQSYSYIYNRFKSFKSSYEIKKHPHDFIYFHPKLLKLYLFTRS